MWPLIRSVSDRARMGEHAIGGVTRVVAWGLFALICGTNLMLIASGAQ
jgi:manganese transport protein